MTKCKDCKTDAHIQHYTAATGRGQDLRVDMAWCENCGSRWRISRPYRLVQRKYKQFKRLGGENV